MGADITSSYLGAALEVLAASYTNQKPLKTLKKGTYMAHVNSQCRKEGLISLPCSSRTSTQQHCLRRRAAYIPWLACLLLAFGMVSKAVALQINWTSSTNFYVDFSSTPTPMNCDYVSCLITNTDGIAYSNLWITLNGFTNTAMRLGGGDPGQYAMGLLANQQNKPAFFYLQATNNPGMTPYKDRFTVSVYRGYPATGTLLAQSNFVVTVTTSGANQANKVTSVTYSPTNNPVVGGIVKMSVKGTKS